MGVWGVRICEARYIDCMAMRYAPVAWRVIPWLSLPQ
jgi:hypothetical protein